jgi:hypothetical protein
MTRDTDQAEPLAGYAALTSAFVLGTGSALVGLERAGRLPERIATSDIALLGIATYSLSRTLSKDRVTAFIRRPFARVQAAAGRGEVESEVEGDGLRRAAGELLICPFCLSQWIATAALVGLCVAPRATRFSASILALRAVSESLNFAHEAAVAEVDRKQAAKRTVSKRAAAA